MIPHAGTPWIPDCHDRLRRLDANCDLEVEPRVADLIHLHASPAILSRIGPAPTLLRKHATKKISERHPCWPPRLRKSDHCRESATLVIDGAGDGFGCSNELAMKSAGNGSGLRRDRTRNRSCRRGLLLRRRRRDRARGGSRLLSRDRSRQSSAHARGRHRRFERLEQPGDRSMFSRNRGVMTVAVVIIAGLVGHDRSPGAHAQGPKTSFARRNMTRSLQKNVMIPMRDGVSLAADLYRPGRDGKAGARALPGAADAHSLQQRRCRRRRPLLRGARVRGGRQ